MTRLPAGGIAPWYVVRSGFVQAMVLGLAAAHLAIEMVPATPTGPSTAAAVRASRSR